MPHMHTVQLSDELSARLASLSKATKRTKSYFLREALEDAYLAETAYEEFVKSGEAAAPLEEVVKNLGLED